MKCLMGNKNCVSIAWYRYAEKSGFICSGLPKNPNPKVDVIKFCNCDSKGKGLYMELTPDETMTCCSVLQSSLSEHISRSPEYKYWRLKKK